MADLNHYLIGKKLDPYGFERSEDFDEKTYEEFMSRYFLVLARRAARWRPLVVGKDTVIKSLKLKRFCRKGIPSEHRPLVWMEVSGAAERMRDEPGLYKQLRSQYLDSSITESIMLDINRTFPENIYFANERDPAGLQRPLKHVLMAFALNNPHVGYCQGLNFVAGLILLILRNEEKAFWLLDTLARHILPDYYTTDMIAIKAEQELCGELIKWKLPDLYEHFNKAGVSWALIAMKWFICLYADVLPVETVLRIWDCLFYEGWKILLRVALVLFVKNKAKLMAASDFSSIIDVVKGMVNDPVVVNCHTFMQSIFKDTGSMPRAKLHKLREECIRHVLAS
ncbi:growth hormone-regulated TBC protein 1-A-like isoform X2 [Pomacea canaliculata]|uniref:growth hormone-regulated TBC protein 1-A-like isoform X2 n=1 Tax=Pomacea canaliculata TaxID=400727 RepID=UPI000D73CCF4|nr:growth hormone-regulated TBC protein 1-A-like isoform X2 [Pomacea canaliculata]